MGLPHLEESLCGCDLRTGSKIIGWLHMIVTIIGLIFTVIGLAALVAATNNEPPEHKEVMKLATVIVIVYLVLLCIIALFSVFLLIGIYKERPSYIYPWVVFTIVCLVLSLIKCVVELSQGLIPNAIGGLIGIAISTYLMLIVNSYHTNLKNGRGTMTMTC